ncbi:MAG: hypothetical protein JNL39_08225 [Opitutaceae bacterium]|nr:hypothetical protein [Opitutaceae bacterium]
MIFASALLLGGCAYAPRHLAEHYGWTAEMLTEHEFRITAKNPAKGRDIEGLAVAGDIAASQGFRSFILIDDPERPDSGSSFSWNYNYVGQPGPMAWAIGSSFRIRCFKEPAKGKLLLDSRRRAKDLSVSNTP